MKGCERNVCEKKYKACVCACGTHPSSAGGYENSAFNSGGERASGGSHKISKRIDEQKPSNTGDSRAIPQPSTNPAQPCLSSMF